MPIIPLKEKFKKITWLKNKTMVISSVIILAIIILWLFYYLPAKSELEEKKSQTKQLKKEIKRIEKSIGEGPLKGGSIEALDEKLVGLKDKFPSKEGQSLKMISNLAQKSDVNLISIKPHSKQPLTDEDKNPIMVDNKVCKRLFVSFQLKSSFFNLINYLEALKQKLPAVITTEILKIKKSGSSGKKLTVNMGINIYLLAKS